MTLKHVASALERLPMEGSTVQLDRELDDGRERGSETTCCELFSSTEENTPIEVLSQERGHRRKDEGSLMDRQLKLEVDDQVLINSLRFKNQSPFAAMQCCAVPCQPGKGAAPPNPNSMQCQSSIIMGVSSCSSLSYAKSKKKKSMVTL